MTNCVWWQQGPKVEAESPGIQSSDSVLQHTHMAAYHITYQERKSLRTQKPATQLLPLSETPLY